MLIFHGVHSFKARNMQKLVQGNKKRAILGGYDHFSFIMNMLQGLCLVLGKVSKGQLFLKWIFLEGSRHPTAVFDRYIFGVQVIPSYRTSAGVTACLGRVKLCNFWWVGNPEILKPPNKPPTYSKPLQLAVHTKKVYNRSGGGEHCLYHKYGSSF